ncbi:MAG: hypothetical protein ACI9QV_000398 [Methylophagaceae bacterium]|jgi:hypothetical protein
MLPNIADPYSLAKYDVFRLSKLMTTMTGKITIASFSNHQKRATDESVLASEFYLECSNDDMTTATSPN